MKVKDVLIFLCGAGLWYLFIFFALFSLTYPVNLLASAFVLLVLAGLGMHCCCYVCKNHFGGCKLTKKK